MARMADNFTFWLAPVAPDRQMADNFMFWLAPLPPTVRINAAHHRGVPTEEIRRRLTPGCRGSY